MVNEKVKSFLIELERDENLQKEVKSLEERAENKALDSLRALALSRNYEFTEQDWKAGIKTLKAKRDESKEFVQKTGGVLTMPSEILALDCLPENLSRF